MTKPGRIGSVTAALTFLLAAASACDSGRESAPPEASIERAGPRVPAVVFGGGGGTGSATGSTVTESSGREAVSTLLRQLDEAVAANLTSYTLVDLQDL